MPTALTPTHAALGGTAILMACACGTATNSTKLLGMGGIGASTLVVHPLFIAAAAGLILYGLWHTLRSSAVLALVGFSVLGAGAVLTPPTVMSSRAVPWQGVQMFGGGLYLIAAALLGYAFWRAFPSPKPAASGTAMGGVALATGCSCCMVTGAIAGMAVTGGASPVFQTMPVIFWTGMAVVAAGLFPLGGLRAVAWVPLGALVIRYGGEVLKLTGDWMVGDANLRSFGGYMVGIAGAALVLYGFVVAYRRSTPVQMVQPEPRQPVREPAPSFAGV